MKNFNGNVIFIDRSDINTDEIIPAKYLTENTKQAMKPYLLEDLKLDGFSPNADLPGKQVIVSRSNFGCGSSREHAPWALEVNDINLVIAESFARIFRRNMFNCGMMAIELSADQIENLFTEFGNSETTLQTDMDQNKFIFESDSQKKEIPFSIPDFDRALVKAGGWVEYADSHY